MVSHRPAFIVDALRTPIGKFRGSLAPVRPDDLAAHVIDGLVRRNPALGGRIDHVVFGATNQAGEDNRNVARMAALIAGLPYEVPAVTVNRLCGSGLEAVTDAVMRLWTGDADVVLAGGVESMTRAPFVFAKSDEPFGRTPPKVYDTSLGWRLENPRLAERFPLLSMGETAENVAERWNIAREAQDEFALASHKKAAAAVVAGAFENEVLPVRTGQRKGGENELRSDESLRGDATLEALSKLPAVFRKGGTVTAGNSSPLNDGSSALLLVSEEVLRNEKLEPLARVVAFATAGVDPNFMGEGPIPATKKVLQRAGWRMSDVDRIELNEAFAAQALACIRGLELDPNVVNPTGGSIALGHPIGCSGARILTTLVHGMVRARARRGLASLCIGVGQGISLLVER